MVLRQLEYTILDKYNKRHSLKFHLFDSTLTNRWIETIRYYTTRPDTKISYNFNNYINADLPEITKQLKQCCIEINKEYNKPIPVYDTVDNKRLNDAINQSDLRDFINNLPKKENTEIADRGINISGGQRQRIGLARALYQNRNVLLLDEATSSVDTDTEDAILKTLHKIKNNRIIIMIAHRQSSIEKCDQIINLERFK